MGERRDYLASSVMRLAILGAGAWGTALAIKLGPRFRISLWARDEALAASIEATRRNDRYLAGFALPESIRR